MLEMVDGNGDKRKVLMDTGLDKRALLQNVKKLEIDLNDVDSHGGRRRESLCTSTHVSSSVPQGQEKEKARHRGAKRRRRSRD